MHQIQDNSENRFELTNFIGTAKGRPKFYFDVADSAFLNNLKNKLVYKEYLVVTEEGRPDLLSENIYGLGNHEFWWLLLYLNNIRSFKDLKQGMVIHYPTLASLESVYFKSVQSKVVERLNNDTKPISKSVRLI